MTPARRNFDIGTVGLYAFLIASVLFFVLPIGLIFLNSLKSMEEIRAGSLMSLPSDPSFEAWKIAWSSACSGLDCNGISPGLWNSIRIVIPAVVLSTLIGALNGFALTEWKSGLSNTMMFLISVALFVPYQSMIYPTVLILSRTGLFGNYAGIVAVHVIFGLPFTTLLFRNFFLGIPHEIMRAARMEGASFLRTFVSVVLPMSTNIMLVVAILQFTGIWNDYLLGLIFAGNDAMPMTVQLNNIVSNTRGAAILNVNMAASLLTALPALAVYFLSGRYFVRGIAAGAVKG